MKEDRQRNRQKGPEMSDVWGLNLKKQVPLGAVYDLGALGTQKKEDTLKAQRDAGWSLMTNAEGWVLELN